MSEEKKILEFKKKPKRVVDVQPRDISVRMPKFRFIRGQKKEGKDDKH